MVKYYDEVLDNNSDSSENDDTVSNPSIIYECDRLLFGLKNLHLEKTRIDIEFDTEVFALKKSFETKYGPIFQKRLKILTENMESKNSDQKCLNSSENERKNEFTDFWLKVLKNNSSICDHIEKYDEPVLKHLIDIRISRNSQFENNTKVMTILVEFIFKKNPYFSPNILQLEITLKVDEELIKIIPIDNKGTHIKWKKDRDVMIDPISKKLRPSCFHLFCDLRRFCGRYDPNVDYEDFEYILHQRWHIVQALEECVANAILYCNKDSQMNQIKPETGLFIHLKKFFSRIF